MKFHSPVLQKQVPIPAFAVRNNELVIPAAIFTREEYPGLPDTMVKIAARDGRNIFLPLSKLGGISTQDI